MHKVLQASNSVDCLIIDNFKNKIEEKLFYFNFKSIKTTRQLFTN